MEKQAYKTKAGVEQYRPVMTTDEYRHYQFTENNMGFCLACGSEAHGVEPDARQYTCEDCGAKKVYGMEELLMMDLLILRDLTVNDAEDVLRRKE